MRSILRVAAVLIAVAGIVDPVFARRTREPLAIDFRLSPSATASAVRDRLVALLGSDVTSSQGEAPAAVVMIGAADPPPIRPGVPISVVTLTPRGPNVRLVRLTQPDVVMPGQEAAIAAELVSTGLVGQVTQIDLEQDGVRLARVEHRWAEDSERFTARFTYVPAATGIHRVHITARTLAGESTSDDNSADIGVVATSRTLRIAVYEPRPSWSSGFVRRALESDPVFDVSAVVHASRGIDVRAGSPPAALTAAALARFDAVIVGAPEDLRSAEIQALDAFSRVRGGAVVFVPDRQPSGAFLSLLPAIAFEPSLTEKSQPLETDRAVGVAASELAVMRDPGRGGVALASVVQQGRPRAVIASWPHGAGRILFSGALDAWRFRAGDNDGFARFWTGTIANVAASAARPLTVSLDRPLVAPGEPVVVRVALGSGKNTEGVQASLVGTNGAQQFVRLWPLAEAGTFEAVTAAAAGEYLIRVSNTGGDIAETPLLVAKDVRHPPALDDESLRFLAAATGGSLAEPDDLTPIRRHLRTLSRPLAIERTHPMRSAWWSLAFVGALGFEWALARRRGAR